MAVALAVVPQQLSESLEEMLESEEDAKSYPQIRTIDDGEEPQYAVVIEGLQVCCSGDIVTIFGAMMASYYIFNLAYPVKLENTLLFYQKVLLGLTDAYSKRNKKVVALLCKLKE